MQEEGGIWGFAHSSLFGRKGREEGKGACDQVPGARRGKGNTWRLAALLRLWSKKRGTEHADYYEQRDGAKKKKVKNV